MSFLLSGTHQDRSGLGLSTNSVGVGLWASCWCTISRTNFPSTVRAVLSTKILILDLISYTQISGHGIRMSTYMSRSISARSSSERSRSGRIRGRLQRNRRASSPMSWESTCSWRLLQRWTRVSRRRFSHWQGLYTLILILREPDIYHDSVISRHTWLTGVQKTQRLEGPHPVLSDSTNPQIRHNRGDVIHEGKNSDWNESLRRTIYFSTCKD